MSKGLARLLAADDTELWLSPISIWELLLFAERRRVDLPAGASAVEWVETALTRTPMLEAPLNREVAFRNRTVRVANDDPADRFLAATADVYDLVLATADRRSLRGKGFRTVGNR